MGICGVRNFIYVVGGYNKDKKGPEKSIERYDVLKGSWAMLPENCNILDVYTMGITVESARKRFLYGFGGMNKKNKQMPDNSTLRVLRLDTENLGPGLKTMFIANPFETTAWCFGVIPLGGTEDCFEFAVFGGNCNGGVKLDKTSIFTTSLTKEGPNYFSLLYTESGEVQCTKKADLFNWNQQITCTSTDLFLPQNSSLSSVKDPQHDLVSVTGN